MPTKPYPCIRTQKRALIKELLLCGLLLYSVETPADSLQKILQQARLNKLWQAHYWHVLLHYTPNVINSGHSSQLDDPEFFLAATGKTSPQAELEATLKALLNDQATDDNAIACRFPARTAWLTNQLDLPATSIRKPCKLLRNWMQNMQADSVTLIFPVAFLNNPASLFGHTFLRFDRKGMQKPDLLAWTVNYAADVDEKQEKGIKFAFKGLTGGYRGKFSIARYFKRVKTYGDLESRDIWEYQLNLSAQEIQRMQWHLWELLPSHFDYFFIDENCSYQLLGLLQSARNDLHLTEQFRFDAIPAETVKAINAVPGLFHSVQYRPSNRNIILQRLQSLSTEQQLSAKSLALGESSIANLAFQHKKPLQQAQVLELAYDYAAYLEAKSNSKQAQISSHKNTIDNPKRLYLLLAARNHLNVDAQKPEITTPKSRPDQGHKGHRIGFRYGYERPDHYLQLDLRWAYHDFFDPSSGFIPGAQLQFLTPALRYYPDKNRWQFESLQLLDIVSMPKRNAMMKPLSWQVSVAATRYRMQADKRPVTGDFKAGLGISHPLAGKGIIALFGQASILMNEHFDDAIAIGAGLKTRAYSDITPSYKIGLTAELLYYFQGQQQATWNVTHSQRFSLTENHALLLDLGYSQEFYNGFFYSRLSWQYYF